MAMTKKAKALATAVNRDKLYSIDEAIGLVEKVPAVITGQGRAQVVAPVALQLQVGALQRCLRVALQHLVQVGAVQALFEAGHQGVDLLARRLGFELPAQLIGGHAQGAGGVDGGGIVLAEPGNHAGTEGAGQGEDGNQQHGKAGTGR